MLGHVIEWYYGYVAGIRQQPGSVGWKRVLIAPVPGPLTEADRPASISPAGRIGSRWSVKDGKFRLDAEIPAGVTAQTDRPRRHAKGRRPRPSHARMRPAGSGGPLQVLVVVEVQRLATPGWSSPKRRFSHVLTTSISSELLAMRLRQ